MASSSIKKLLLWWMTEHLVPNYRHIVLAWFHETG